MLRCGLATDWQMDRGGCSQRRFSPSILQRMAGVNCRGIAVPEESAADAAKQGGNADKFIRPWWKIFLPGAFCFLGGEGYDTRRAMADFVRTEILIRIVNMN